MATRSVIGYIQEDDSYIGCYCHYDGYPSGVGSNLLKMNAEDIRTMVTAGIMKGGIRAINSPDLAEVEYFHEHWPEAKRTQVPGGEEYTYILYPTGAIECLDREGTLLPDSEWHR
jgi:hypothetical protein